jgi:hypothetical protein
MRQMAQLMGQEVLLQLGSWCGSICGSDFRASIHAMR